jgi:FkbM family methyltransferase
MSRKYKKFIQECLSLPSPANGLPVLVYGIGSKGQETALALLNQGAQVMGFLDAKAQPGQIVSDLPVFTLEDWLMQNDPTCYGVVIAINNPAYWRDVDKLIHHLQLLGFAWCSHFTFHSPEPYCRILWLFIDYGRELYNNFSDQLDCLDALLGDEKSRLCLEDIVASHISARFVKNYTSEDQYMPHDLPAWPNPLRFIDCGAYIGDTLGNFGVNGYAFEAIAVFEPDPNNFPFLLRNTSRDTNIIRFPCAVGAKSEIVSFSVNANGTSSNVIHCEGEERRGEERMHAQCVALDEVLPDFAPNLIKMDIEGAEYGALLGAKYCIKQYRPGLAICLYHRREHLWEIPFLINQWRLNYRFYLRTHAPFCTEYVLYAFPAEWVK